MVSEHALPRAPKSADRIEGAMIAGGDMARGSRQWEMLSVSFVRGMGVVGFGANDAWMGGSR